MSQLRYEYDEQTALIVVDVQNDFADATGSLYVNGGEQTLTYINDQITAAEVAGSFVVYTQDWHPFVTPHFEKDGGEWPVHCVADSWGSQFQHDLRVVGPSVKKGTRGEDGYSGFTMRDPVDGAETKTELEKMLRDRGVTRVAILGLATDYCVKSTAIDAANLGFQTSLLADGVRPVDLEPGDGARAIAEMVGAGVTVV